VTPGPDAGSGPEPSLTAPLTVPVALVGASAPPAAVVAAASTGPARIAVSGAGIRGPGGCVQRNFHLAVRGAKILRVDFTLDGKNLRRVNKRDASGLYRVTVNTSRVSRTSHKVNARVAFIPGVAPRVRNVSTTFNRCAKAAVAPAFTG
jgi:hypothetical protein